MIGITGTAHPDETGGTQLYETREQWGSTQTDPAGTLVGIQVEVVAHHTWKPHVDAGVSVAREREVVRGIQGYHVGKGWDDIGYSFLVFQSGRAYEGRGWFRTGAHTKGQNRKPSIVFVIDGDQHEPTKAAWKTARTLLREGVRVGALIPQYLVAGHTDYAIKSCPGTRTYPLIREQLAHDFQEETGVRLYAQAVVVPTAAFLSKVRDFDRALGAVVADTYGLALVETKDGRSFTSLTHPGEPAKITDWAEVVGAARYDVRLNPPAHRLAGEDRWDTAAAVATFIQDHEPAEWKRRGRPYVR